MRQKTIKGVDEDLLQSRGVITDVYPLDLPNTSIHLEIGSGKGAFITQLAIDHPHEFFIALEKNKYVCYRILEKKEALHINNLAIILGDASDLLTYIGDRKINYIYLNFSDPWPKKKHHKRRLTASSFLNLYIKMMTKDSILQFRTDHQTFFEDSVETISKQFDIYDMDCNLPESLYMTEYETKKRKNGPIYQLKGRVKHVT